MGWDCHLLAHFDILCPADIHVLSLDLALPFPLDPGFVISRIL